MGMFLGYILRRYKDHKPTPMQVRLGWTFGFMSFIMTLFVSTRMNFPDYKYNKFEAALYAAFAPAAWCTLSAWIIFISEKGSNSEFFWRGNIESIVFHCDFSSRVSLTDQIVQLFKMRVQRIFTKLAYAIYLTQFPVFFYNVGKVRNAEYFEFIKIMVSETLTGIL